MIRAMPGNRHAEHRLAHRILDLQSLYLDQVDRSISTIQIMTLEVVDVM
jgi:hypothetical protein